MNQIRAVAFDLFNTLITVDSETLKVANATLIEALRESGFQLDEESFKTGYREAAVRLLEECRATGRETHNRFWISAGLASLGHEVDPYDPRITGAVEAYFSGFYCRIRLIEGTRRMLAMLKEDYRLGLLSNFTHGPAARRIIAETGLAPFFQVVLISGELGYRKPSPIVFEKLVEQLGVEREHILYVGDDPEPDIAGAQAAGLHPVWTTYVMDHNLPYGPRIVDRDGSAPGGDVPRISSWEDLLRLLDVQA
ncbi:MAG: HAD family hydrolase [Deltaproteobacteria bacterium]|nr:HAD family hydrolase [Deltaproteobacteria bacterium]